MISDAGFEQKQAVCQQHNSHKEEKADEHETVFDTECFYFSEVPDKSAEEKSKDPCSQSEED